MDARLARWALLAAVFSSLGAPASLGASYRTPNFVVEAPTAQMAEQIGRAAEKYRRELAIDWLGSEMANWAQPCPITAQVAENLGAGGATSFYFEHGEVFGWRMTIQGSPVRILDSVLPHEITHTVFATHFRQPLPRWADEGACTTVEHSSERAKQQRLLVDFLREGRGIAFRQMFAMKEYPHDVMPLYSQGYSVARYLVAQGGKRKFLDYLSDGMRDENWARATQQHYGIADLGALQNTWLDWVRRGSPVLDTPKPGVGLVAVATSPKSGGRTRPEANLIHRGQSPDPPQADRQAQASSQRVGPSIYELASTSKDALRPRDAERGKSWHAPRPSVPGPAPAEVVDEQTDAGDDEATVPHPVASYQVTRPQPAQGPRQVILEWSRPNPAAASGAAGQ
jgi:hypothetical protein